jgi:pilus assembly protein CpaB
MTILLSAFVVAAACAFLVYKVVGSRLTETHTVTSTKVVAAAADIKLGTVLKASDLSTIEIVGTPPKGTILKPENAVGRGVVADLFEGEAINESRLAAPGSGGGLAPTIPVGMRACAVRVDEVVGVAGFVTPGMRVDVLISGLPPGDNSAIQQGTQVRTLLQNIQVLSAGTDIEKTPDGKPQQVQVVNLLVTPEQAESLSLASNNQTHIQLVLRNPLDTQISPVPGTAMVNLFSDKNPAPAKPHGPAPKPAPKPAAPKPFSIEIINGSKKSQTNFSTPEVKQ